MITVSYFDETDYVFLIEPINILCTSIKNNPWPAVGSFISEF
jgi:hypothetical protein